MSNTNTEIRYEIRPMDPNLPTTNPDRAWEIVDLRWGGVVLYDQTAEQAQAICYLMNMAWEQGMRDAVDIITLKVGVNAVPWIKSEASKKNKEVQEV